MSPSLSKHSFLTENRNVVIAGSVLLFHAMAIWALQTGLLMRAVEIVVPAAVLAQMIEPPKPTPPPAPVISKELPPPEKQQVVKRAPTVPQTQAAPQILATETATPAPNAPAPVQIAPPAPVLSPSVPVAAVASPAPTTPAPIAPAKAATPACVEDYISQPKPTYPRLSKNLGEQGVVGVRVLFSPAGLPKSAEIEKSSGFERLDRAAIEGTQRWRFISCRSVLAEADHWEPAPVTFKLD
jgi:periplasmic protein TonB